MASMPTHQRQSKPWRIILCALVCLPTARALAQHATHARDLEPFRDSIQSLSDTAALRALDRRLGHRSDDDAARLRTLLERGVVRLRLGEMGDGWSFGRAAGSFKEVTERTPALPDGWYGLALAKEGQADWLASDPLNLGTRVGEGARRDALAAYADALARAPDYVPALLGLSRTALALRDTTLFAQRLLPAVRRATATPGRVQPDAIYLRALAEREAGDPDTAAVLFQKWLDLGGNPGLGRLQLARSQFLGEHGEGEAAYYEGAVYDDSSAVTAYRADLAVIADSESLAEFDAVAGTARATVLHRFWDERDRLELRAPGERLREHYRRIAYARHNFPLLTNRRQYAWRDAYRSGSSEFDDRGVVYIRQGAPSERVVVPIFGMMPSETWCYRRADEVLLLHFSSGGAADGDYEEGGDLQDYRLVPSLFSLRGASPDHLDMLLNSHSNLLDLYAKFLEWGPFGRARAIAEEQALVVRSIVTGVTTDAFELSYAHPLVAHTDLVVLGRSGAGSLAHVVFVIPVARQSGDSAAVRLPVRLRFVLLDERSRPVQSLDTSASVPARPAGDSLLEARSSFVFSVPPGRWRYRMALESSGGFGRLFPRDSFAVGADSTSALQLSELALATRARGVPWAAGVADTAWLAPEREVNRRQPLELYYEVYGLGEGERFRTSLVLRRGKKPALSLSFDDAAAGDITRIRRTLSLAALRPGRYRLEVTVSRADGVVATRGREVIVEESDRTPQ